MTYLFISHTTGAAWHFAARRARERLCTDAIVCFTTPQINYCVHCAHKRHEIDIERPHLQRGMRREFAIVFVMFPMCGFMFDPKPKCKRALPGINVIMPANISERIKIKI
jgi:hypothetical protein